MPLLVLDGLIFHSLPLAANYQPPSKDVTKYKILWEQNMCYTCENLFVEHKSVYLQQNLYIGLLSTRRFLIGRVHVTCDSGSIVTLKKELVVVKKSMWHDLNACILMAECFVSVSLIKFIREQTLPTSCERVRETRIRVYIVRAS